MKKHRKFLFYTVLMIVLVLMSSCAPIGPSESELAYTYAAQTMTAMPTATMIPSPTGTAVPTATATQRNTATPEPQLWPVGPENFPENVNPLTGLVVDDPSLLDRRPVLVKVANYPPSGRPHAGLSFADIVFEYYIGYGSNRFMGLYYGQNTNKIGPVRSGRLVDPKIVNMYQGILGFEGAYVTILDQIVEVLGERAISGTGNVCPAICDDGRNIVTSVFADSEALTELSNKRGVVNEKYVLNGMVFDPQVRDGGDEGTQANILFSSLNRGEWRFDEESGMYLRWIEDTSGNNLEMVPLVDSQTDEQLSFSNVVVLFAYYTEFTPAMHDIDIWGNTTGRRAVIFRDGRAFDVTWVSARNDQPIQFRDEDGEIFPLKPGNSWFVLFGSNSGVTTEDGAWTFNFYMP
ncbi:MAG: DUF3048 domain-containing protein [Anaerolineales bacterium]